MFASPSIEQSVLIDQSRVQTQIQSFETANETFREKKYRQMLMEDPLDDDHDESRPSLEHQAQATELDTRLMPYIFEIVGYEYLNSSLNKIAFYEYHK